MSAPEYVDIQKNWRKLGPIYRSTAAQKITVREIVASFTSPDIRLTRLLWIAQDHHPKDWRFSMFDSGDWRCMRAGRGRPPSYQNFFGVGCCHWSAVQHFHVATQWRPDQNWRLMASEKHSCSVSEDGQLFDPHWMAMGVPAAETLASVMDNNGEDITPYLSEHGTYHDVCFEETLDLLRAQGHGGLVGVITNFLSEGV